MVDFIYYKPEKEILEKIPEALIPYLNYWDTCEKIDPLGVPSNTKINPAIFRKHLPWIILMEINEHGQASFKVHGTALAHIYGDMTGLTVADSSLADITKANLSAVIGTAIETVTPVYQEGLNLKRIDTHLSNLRVLSLAFSKSETFIDHILLISQSDYPAAKEKPLF